MRIVIAAIVVSLAAPAMLFGQSMTGHDHKGGNTSSSKSGKKADGPVQTIGRVIKVDFVQDELIITHEPIPRLDWPVMTMVFKVKDRKMLDRVRPGLIVDFVFVESGADYVVIEIK